MNVPLVSQSLGRFWALVLPSNTPPQYACNSLRTNDSDARKCDHPWMSYRNFGVLCKIMATIIAGGYKADYCSTFLSAITDFWWLLWSLDMCLVETQIIIVDAFKLCLPESSATSLVNGQVIAALYSSKDWFWPAWLASTTGQSICRLLSVFYIRKVMGPFFFKSSPISDGLIFQPPPSLLVQFGSSKKDEPVVILSWSDGENFLATLGFTIFDAHRSLNLVRVLLALLHYSWSSSGWLNVVGELDFFDLMHFHQD